MNTIRFFLFLISLIASLFLMNCSADKDQLVPESPVVQTGLITMDSPYSFDKTGSRIYSTLEDRGLLIPADLNHHQNAASVDMELRPTRVIIFGNPNLGTPLMQCSQSIAIDLPQKVLIWEDESGSVKVTYNDPEYLKQRHTAENCDEPFETVANELDNLIIASLEE